jgi:hypothetical protein
MDKLRFIENFDGQIKLKMKMKMQRSPAMSTSHFKIVICLVI